MTTSLGVALEAFILEREYCGALGAAVEGDPRLDDVYVRGRVQLERG